MAEPLPQCPQEQYRQYERKADDRRTRITTRDNPVYHEVIEKPVDHSDAKSHYRKLPRMPGSDRV
jgi:hypothetical protein